MQLDNDRALDIPAGDSNFLVTDQFTLPEDAQLLAIYPHAHYLCRDMLALARFPDGTEKTLIHIPRWNLNWQAVFRLAQPEPLARGTTIVMRYRYDNSSGNISNPNHPPSEFAPGIAPWTRWRIVGCRSSRVISSATRAIREWRCRKSWRAITSRITRAILRRHYNLAAMCNCVARCKRRSNNTSKL